MVSLVYTTDYAQYRDASTRRPMLGRLRGRAAYRGVSRSDSGVAIDWAKSCRGPTSAAAPSFRPKIE